MKQLNPRDVFRKAQQQARRPLFQAPSKHPDAPKPQPAPPDFSLTVEQGNKKGYGTMFLSIKKLEEPKPQKKETLLVFKSGTIHRSISDMFKYYSGRKGYEQVRGM